MLVLFLYEFCAYVVEKLQQKWIQFPQDIHSMQRHIQAFQTDWQFPQCIGAIDGCHIEVSPPHEEAIDHHNFKGWYSFVLLECVSADYKFTYINIGSSGHNNDSHILRNSHLYSLMTSTMMFQCQHTIVPLCLHSFLETQHFH